MYMYFGAGLTEALPECVTETSQPGEPLSNTMDFGLSEI